MGNFVFYAVGVSVFMFTILCYTAGHARETIYYFLTQNQIRIRPKIV